MGGCTSIFSPTIGRLATAWFVWCLFFPPCCGMPPWCTPTVLCYYHVLVTLWSCVLSYPAPSIPVFAPRSLIPARLHLHCAPRSLIIDYCTSPLPCLPLGFSAVFVLFPRQAEITFVFCNPLPIRVGASCYRRPPYLRSCLPQCSCLQPKKQTKKNVVTSSQHFFLNPKEGSVPWTEPTSGLSPQKGIPRACRTLTYTRTDRLC